MHWIASSEKDTDNPARIFSLSASQGERAGVRCWTSGAADQFRANSGLKSQEYSAPVLGLIFLRFAEVRFASARRVSEHKKNPAAELSIHGDEETDETGRLCRQIRPFTSGFS